MTSELKTIDNWDIFKNKLIDAMKLVETKNEISDDEYRQMSNRITGRMLSLGFNFKELKNFSQI